MPKNRPTPAKGRPPHGTPVSVVSRPAMQLIGKHDWITEYQKKAGQTIQDFITASGRGPANKKVGANATRKHIVLGFIKSKNLADIEAGICSKTLENTPVQTTLQSGDIIDLTKPDKTTTNIKQLRNLDEHISACHGYLTKIGHLHRVKLDSLEDDLQKTTNQIEAAMPADVLDGILNLIDDHGATSDGREIQKLVAKLTQQRENAFLKRKGLEEDIRIAVERSRALEDYCQAIEEQRIKHVRPALRDLESKMLGFPKKEVGVKNEPQE